MTATLNLTKSTPALDLTKIAPSLVKVKGVLTWKEHPIHKASKTQGFDLDIFAFVTQNGKIGEIPDHVCFFNNKSVAGDAVVYPHDSRDGSDDEEIHVTFSKLPAVKDAVELFVFIHEGAQRKQDFSMIQGGEFTLYDEGDKVLQRYELQQFVNGTAVHIGSLKRGGSGWNFQPVGEPAEADANDVLQAFV